MSISLADRGQTTQDFAVGIGLFLLAIAFVFMYVPTLATPFSTPVGGAETAQADRIAATVVEDLSTDDGTNELNLTDFDEYDDEGYRIEHLGLRSTETDTGDNVSVDRVNITIYSSLNETDSAYHVNTTGPSDDDARSTSSASRIVTDTGDQCDPACRLTVRVW